MLPHTVLLARDSFLLAFPALFSIVNPLGAAIIFLQVAGDHTPAQRSVLARTVAFYSLILLMVSIWAGSLVLAFFGVSISALRVAGGLVVAVRGWAMLQTPEDSEQKRQKQVIDADGQPVASGHWKDIAFFPLTLPFTVGPGAISVAIALSSGDSGSHFLASETGISLAAILVCAIVWAAYASSERLSAFLGVTGTRILARLAALILLAIGVQIFAGGVQGFATSFWKSLPHS